MNVKYLLSAVVTLCLCKSAELGVSMQRRHGYDQHLLYKNVVVPHNWQTDDRYEFHWQGAFSYGLPPAAKCDRVITPPFGRMVCSDSKGLSRTMCLTECMIGFERIQKSSSVFICRKDGSWMDIYKKRISTPFFQCAQTNYVPS